MLRSKFNLSWLSKYRNELFGLAAISIIIYHFTSDYVESDLFSAGGSVASILTNGYCEFISSIGVEIFLLLSGMGLFFAFSKEEKLGPFYKRRLLRIIPTYCLVCIPYYIVRDLIITNQGILAALKHFSFYSFIKNGDVSMWFIFAILVFYLVYPILYYLFKGKRHNLVCLFALLLIVVVFFLKMQDFAPAITDNISLMLSRIPIFIIGCYMAPFIKKQKQIPLWMVCIWIIFAFVGRIALIKMGVGVLATRGFNVILCAALVLLCCMILNTINITGRMEIVRKVLNRCGIHSLELYMTHTALRWIFKNIGWHTSDIRAYAVVVLLSVLLSFLLHALATKLNDLVLYKRHQTIL